MLNFCFRTPKKHIIAQNHVVWRILRENRFRAWAVGRWKNPEKRSRVNIFDAQFHAHGEKETPWEIVTKFCVWVDRPIQDIITCATFYDDRLRGLGWQGVEFPISPLTCVVALTTLSHYRASVWQNDIHLLQHKAATPIHCSMGWNNRLLHAGLIWWMTARSGADRWPDYSKPTAMKRRIIAEA